MLFIERSEDFLFFLSLLTINFCLHMSEDLRMKGGAVPNSLISPLLYYYYYYYNFFYYRQQIIEKQQQQ